MSEDVQKLLAKIADLENRLAALEGKPQTDDVFREVFVASDDGSGKWTEQYYDGSDFQDWDDGRQCDDDGEPSKAIDLSGKMILLEIQHGDEREYVRVGGGGFFPVKVSKDGGSNGNKTTAATYTYTVTTMDGATTLGTSIAVVKPRPNGTMTAGSSYGVAFYDESGDLQLWDAGEKEGTGSC